MKNKIPYILCTDIGNSLTKYAVFKNDKIIKHTSTVIFDLHTVQSLYQTYHFQSQIISSVKSLSKSSIHNINKIAPTVWMSVTLKLPIKINYNSPNTLGKDRIAAVCGAVRLYNHTDLLVIGIGTCITYDFVNHKQEYLGGLISPGLDMRLKAMHTFTAKLPYVQKNLNAKLIGNDTTTALSGGALWGMQAEMERMIDYYQERFPNLKVILAGGGANFFKKRLKKTIFAHPNLVVMGLNHILSLNV